MTIERITQVRYQARCDGDGCAELALDAITEDGARKNARLAEWQCLRGRWLCPGCAGTVNVDTLAPVKDF